MAGPNQASCCSEGNLRGVSEALEKGAWTETRRPLVMKPQKPEPGKKSSGDDPANVGMTPIMWGLGGLCFLCSRFSAQRGSADCVGRLLKARADINAARGSTRKALFGCLKQ